MDEFSKRVGTQITKWRWGLGLSGVLSMAFGVAIIAWPNISLFALVIVFGAFSLAQGIVGLAAAIASPIKQGRAWLVVSSLLGIAVGVLVFLYTDMSALALLYVIGAYAIALGVLWGAFVGPLDGGDSALLGLTGLVSIAIGVVMFAKPGDGALVLLALIAAWALVLGIAEVAVAIGGKRMLNNDRKRALGSAEPQTTSR